MKNSLQIIALFIALCFVVLLTACQEKKAETTSIKEKPKMNILLIMADDLGYSDIGCYGSEINTPNLDSLADSGLRMTRFYNAARCCPSRTALLTGLYPHQAGMGGMVKNLGVPAYQGYLNDNCVTIAEVLKDNGYNTLMSGKWHVGDGDGQRPLDRGFERYFGLLHGASSYFTPTVPYRPKHVENPLRVLIDDTDYEIDSNFYMTTAITEHAQKFIENQSPEKPFFMYLAYTAPHWPLHALPEDIARYRGKYKEGWDVIRQQRFKKQQQLGIVAPDDELSPRFIHQQNSKTPDWDLLTEAQKDTWDLRMATYAAMIDRMDYGIGEIMKTLKANGQAENTLVVFLSDNGGSHEEVFEWKDNIIYSQTGQTGTVSSFDSYGYPWANVSNTPYRLFKSYTMEGGFSSPFIVSFPDSDKQTISTEPAHITDLMPTCLNIAGVSYPAKYKGHDIIPNEGVSLLPLLEGKEWQGRKALFWEHEDNKAVWKDEWKLVFTRDSANWELYNIKKDRAEMHSLANQHPEKVAELSALYQEWADRVGVIVRDSLPPLLEL